MILFVFVLVEAITKQQILLGNSQKAIDWMQLPACDSFSNSEGVQSSAVNTQNIFRRMARETICRLEMQYGKPREQPLAIAI